MNFTTRDGLNSFLSVFGRIEWKHRPFAGDNFGYLRTISVPYFLPCIFFGVLPLISLRKYWAICRRNNRIRENRCGQCGYDLRASKGVCPECGIVIPESLPKPDAEIVSAIPGKKPGRIYTLLAFVSFIIFVISTTLWIWSPNGLILPGIGGSMYRLEFLDGARVLVESSISPSASHGNGQAVYGTWDHVIDLPIYVLPVISFFIPAAWLQAFLRSRGG